MLDIKADYALIPIGGSYTMDMIAAVNACKEIQAKYVIPMHYNTHERIRQNPLDFSRAVTRLKPVVLTPGQRIELLRG